MSKIVGSLLLVPRLLPWLDVSPPATQLTLLGIISLAANDARSGDPIGETCTRIVLEPVCSPPWLLDVSSSRIRRQLVQSVCNEALRRWSARPGTPRRLDEVSWATVLSREWRRPGKISPEWHLLPFASIASSRFPSSDIFTDLNSLQIYNQNPKISHIYTPLNAVESQVKNWFDKGRGFSRAIFISLQSCLWNLNEAILSFPWQLTQSSSCVLLVPTFYFKQPHFFR